MCVFTEVKKVLFFSQGLFSVILFSGGKMNKICGMEKLDSLLIKQALKEFKK